MAYFIVVLNLDDFESYAVCVEAREFICFFIVCVNVTADEIMIGGSAASALR